MSSNKQHNNLSREDLQRYLSSTDEQEKRALEGKALEYDFDMESLDGWASSGIKTVGLNQLDKKFNPKISYNWIVYSCIAAVGVIVGVYFLTNEKEKPTIAAINIEKTDVVLPDSVNNLKELPQAELISVKEVKPKKIEQTTELPTVAPEKKEFISVKQLPILKPEFQSSTTKLQKVEAKEIYLNNLKLIDYRTYRKRPNLTVETFELSGVPADKEAREVVDESKVKDMDVAYYDYIKKTTDLLFSEDYKQALARLNIILAHYSDDLNALFYSGLCYYNLAEYRKATELFKSCLTSKFSNFDEEAEWLLAKSYEALGETDKAKAIFKLIKERGGFYSKKVM